MKIALRSLVIIAAIWAILPPLSYGILFTFFTDWSAIFDFVIVGLCICLVLAAFKHIPFAIWSIGFFGLTIIALAGFCYHFEDSGASGPIPFEWLNRYFGHAMPLLAVSLLNRLIQKTQKAEQTGPANPRPCGTSVMSPANPASGAGAMPEGCDLRT